MNELLNEIRNRKKLNVSLDSEDIIGELKDMYEEYGNIEVNVYYKLIDLEKETEIPIVEGVDYKDYPIFVDFLTLNEVSEFGVDEDLKPLNVYRMEITEAIELFEFQNEINKSWKALFYFIKRNKNDKEIKMKINTLIEKTKADLTDFVNEALNEGVPISVIKLMFDSLNHDIENTLNAVIKQEATLDETQSEQVQALDNEATYEINEDN